jgi:hypothetical protein
MNTATEKIPALLTPRAPSDPNDDGRTHINISSTSATQLGRDLTHFAAIPFIHPIYGPFKTMEGFWHYIKGEDKDDAYRTMTASKAKAYAKTKRTVKRPNFIAIVKEANFYKIEQNEALKALMVESSLPFEYYYLFGDERLKIQPNHSVWLCASFEEIRRLLKSGQRVDQQPIADWTLRADDWSCRR